MVVNQVGMARLPASVEVVIRSHGYYLYTLEFHHGEAVHFYSEDGRSPHRFVNLIDIKTLLEQFPIREAWLVHQSAYDEMVGQPGGGENTLKVKISLALPY